LNLLVVRHAIAEDKERFALTGRSDDLRPLTAEGRAKMRRAAQGLCALAPRPAFIASSPLVRARETAEILSTALAVPRIETVEALRPDASYEDLAAWLSEPPAAGQETVALVGHEPHLGGLATWLMAGTGESRIEFKKGGAALLELDGPAAPGAATLRWLATPALLRSLAE
jgi:phosphohistidine phosphatase